MADDDPKAQPLSTVKAEHEKKAHPVPRFKICYRRLTTASLEKGQETDFNAVELDFYPVSKYFRFGLQTVLGFAGDQYNEWFFTAGLAAGIQYPARVTPFLEGRFEAGVIGADVLGQSLASYLYTGGVEGGIELYVARRYYLTLALGWAHPVFGGVDIVALKANPTHIPAITGFEDDTFTFKVGVGL